MGTKVKHFTVDVESQDAEKLIDLLAQMPQTMKVEDGGEYQNCPGYNQVLVSTELDESQLDWFLWRKGNIDYVGVVERRN